MKGYGVLVMLLALLYVVSPVDANPGPVDDLVVLIIGFMMGKGMLCDSEYDGKKR